MIRRVTGPGSAGTVARNPAGTPSLRGWARYQAPRRRSRCPWGASPAESRDGRDRFSRRTVDGRDARGRRPIEDGQEVVSRRLYTAGRCDRDHPHRDSSP